MTLFSNFNILLLGRRIAEAEMQVFLAQVKRCFCLCMIYEYEYYHRSNFL